MSVNVCPIAVVQASAEHVWEFLSEPAHYALWWDAKTRRVTPDGRAQAGQQIYAQTFALGRQWDVHVIVQDLDDAKRQIYLKTMLPFGITVFNHITCTELPNSKTQVSFG